MTGSPRLLGRDDEPQDSGAVVAVHYGNRDQEIWVASGANIGVWYPLGGEFWAAWDRQQMPTGVTKKHPIWTDVLARGPVTLLAAGDDQAYRDGWRAGRQHMWRHMEDLTFEDPKESR